MGNKNGTKERLAILIVGWEVTFEERFGALVEMAGGAVKAAKQCGVSRNTLYLWGKSDGKIPLNKALKLAEAAGVTLDWVATGWERRPDLPKVAPDVVPPEEALDLARVPLLGVSAAAGAGAANDTAEVEDHIYMPRAQLRALGVPPDFVHFIRVRGDSMEPTIADGAIVLIDASLQRYRGEAIYALSQDGDVRIKRLAKAVDGGFMAISDNPIYPPERLSPAELYGLRIEGRVLWTERRL